MIRRGSIICTCAALSVQWPILQSTQLVIDYGTGFEAGFAFCWREWTVNEEWKKEKRRHGPVKAICGFMLGFANVIASSVCADAATFWAYKVLRHAAMPAFPALSLSLWAGSLAVRSAARWFSLRQPTASCGEACVLLAKANSAALVICPRPRAWSLIIVQLLGALACTFGAEVAVARGVEDVSLQQMLAWLLQKPPRAPDHPALYVSSELEDDLEEVGCHDMKCPITFSLLMQPVEVHGKVYEQRAVLEWIKMRHTVPHSPRDPVSEHSLRPCGPMHRLLQEFRHEFRDQLSITWVPELEADRVSLDPADVF